MDTYSFGIVLFEIAAGRLPYATHIDAAEARAVKNFIPKLLRDISLGKIKPELAGESGLRRFHVSGKFKRRRYSFPL